MALQLSVQVSEQEIYPEAYIHIVHATTSSNTKITNFFVNWYKTKEEREESKKFYSFEQKDMCPRPFKQGQYTLENTEIAYLPLWSKMYDYLKSLPEFAGAIDILDVIIEEVVSQDLQPTQSEAQA